MSFFEIPNSTALIQKQKSCLKVPNRYFQQRMRPSVLNAAHFFHSDLKIITMSNPYFPYLRKWPKAHLFLSCNSYKIINIKYLNRNRLSARKKWNIPLSPFQFFISWSSVSCSLTKKFDQQDFDVVLVCFCLFLIVCLFVFFF